MQGENGDVKNRGMADGGGLKVEMNHIGGNVSCGSGDKGGRSAIEAADFPDSSIGEGMDITIQGVNGHVKKPGGGGGGGGSGGDQDDSRRRSCDGVGNEIDASAKKPALGVADASAAATALDGEREPQNFCSDMSIGRGMDISICGDGDTGNKESAMNDDDCGGGGSWKYNGVHKESSKEQVRQMFFVSFRNFTSPLYTNSHPESLLLSLLFIDQMI